MYPFVRFVRSLRLGRRLPPIGLQDWHVSEHVCWPWDLDPFIELNNGRALTLYDLGRFPLALRTGLIGAMRRNGWGLTVAGSTVRYRRRIRMFDRFTMRSRCVGWDARFLYLEQSMWRRGECASHLLIRSAITDAKGIVPTSDVVRALGLPVESPALPKWVHAWIMADAERPWPPER